MDKVLIIDDEKELGEIICDLLEFEGILGVCCFDGQDALPCFLKHKPSVVILDIMLPKVNGMELLMEIRKNSKVPIIMLSARLSDTDKVMSLGFGADDYVTKPFSTRELVARIKAQLRRYKMLIDAGKENDDVISIGEMIIDRKRYTVLVGGRKIDLSAKEFEILCYLAINKNQVLTKEMIYNKIWDNESFGDLNTVSVHIRKIREKIESDPKNPRYIKTIWSVGYKLDYEDN